MKANLFDFYTLEFISYKISNLNIDQEHTNSNAWIVGTPTYLEMGNDIAYKHLLRVTSHT